MAVLSKTKKKEKSVIEVRSMNLRIPAGIMEDQRLGAAIYYGYGDRTTFLLSALEKFQELVAINGQDEACATMLKFIPKILD